MAGKFLLYGLSASDKGYLDAVFPCGKDRTVHNNTGGAVPTHRINGNPHHRLRREIRPLQ